MVSREMRGCLRGVGLDEQRRAEKRREERGERRDDSREERGEERAENSHLREKEWKDEERGKVGEKATRFWQTCVCAGHLVALRLVRSKSVQALLEVVHTCAISAAGQQKTPPARHSTARRTQPVSGNPHEMMTPSTGRRVKTTVQRERANGERRRARKAHRCSNRLPAPQSRAGLVS